MRILLVLATMLVLFAHEGRASESPQLDSGLWRRHVLRVDSSDNNPVKVNEPQTHVCLGTEYAHDPGKFLLPQPVVASLGCEQATDSKGANTTVWRVNCLGPEPFSSVITAEFDSPRHFSTTTVMTISKLPKGEIELITETEYDRIGDCEK